MMGKLEKKIMWIASLLLLVLAMGCSLKIDIDPDRLKGAEPSQSEKAR